MNVNVQKLNHSSSKTFDSQAKKTNEEGIKYLFPVRINLGILIFFNQLELVRNMIF